MLNNVDKYKLNKILPSFLSMYKIRCQMINVVKEQVLVFKKKAINKSYT